MIVKEHFKHYDRLRKYCQSPMLMLGNQANQSAYDFGVSYKTLDPDGGTISWDLNKLIPPEWLAKYGTVFNLGTIEHVWDVHSAFVNVIKMLRIKGTYLHEGPVAGYEDHGIHITDWRLIRDFFTMNGFGILESWFTLQNGKECGSPYRGCHKNILYWFAAEKIRSEGLIKIPQQIFKGGLKVK